MTSTTERNEVLDDERPERRSMRRIYVCPVCGGELQAIGNDIYCPGCPVEFVPVVCGNSNRRN